MSTKLFTFGKPAKGTGFTDREKETSRLVANFKYGINTFIVSPRRWGKTSLVMKAMEQAKSEDLKIVFVDVFNCKDPLQFCEKVSSAVLSQTSGIIDEAVSNAKDFLSRISFEFGVSSDPFNTFGLQLGMKEQKQDMEDMLELPQKIAGRQGKEVVICIDEFQQIGEFHDSITFQRTLRSIWQHQENVTYCLFGSRKHMMESLFDNSDKPFYKFGDIMYLDYIPVSYWIDFIRTRFKEGGKTISEDICRRICGTVEMNSSYIQQLAWYLFQETADTATEEELRIAVEELIAQNTPLFESRTESLTSYQMNFLRAVAEGVTSGFSQSSTISRYKLGSSANVAAITNTLIRKDLIQEKDGKTILTDPVLGMWILRN